MPRDSPRVVHKYQYAAYKAVLEKFIQAAKKNHGTFDINNIVDSEEYYVAVVGANRMAQRVAFMKNRCKIHCLVLINPGYALMDAIKISPWADVRELHIWNDIPVEIYRLDRLSLKPSPNMEVLGIHGEAVRAMEDIDMSRLTNLKIFMSLYVPLYVEYDDDSLGHPSESDYSPYIYKLGEYEFTTRTPSIIDIDPRSSIKVIFGQDVELTSDYLSIVGSEQQLSLLERNVLENGYNPHTIILLNHSEDHSLTLPTKNLRDLLELSGVVSFSTPIVLSNLINMEICELIFRHPTKISRGIRKLRNLYKLSLTTLDDLPIEYSDSFNRLQRLEELTIQGAIPESVLKGNPNATINPSLAQLTLIRPLGRQLMSLTKDSFTYPPESLDILHPSDHGLNYEFPDEDLEYLIDCPLVKDYPDLLYKLTDKLISNRFKIEEERSMGAQEDPWLAFNKDQRRLEISQVVTILI